MKYNESLSLFLTNFFEKLNLNKVVYCVCGNYSSLPHYTDNDVDLWCKDVKLVTKLLYDVCAELNFRVYCINTNAVGSNIFIYSIIRLKVVYFHIDILSECRWYSVLPLVRDNLIEEHRKKFKNFYVADKTVDAAMHLMYPLSHFGFVPKKYYNDICSEFNNARFWNIIKKGWGADFTRRAKLLLCKEDWTGVEQLYAQNKIKLFIHSLARLKLRDIYSVYFFVVSNIIRLYYPSGLFVAFVGPDGCGKTTVISNLNSFFNNGFTKKKFKKFYWRPFLFPRIKQLLVGNKFDLVEEGLPLSTRLNLKTSGFFSRVIHFIKFIYYWFDFVFGRIKYQGCWSRGGAVCFDRYWHDLLVFPERFGLTIPQKVVSAMSFFVPRPDIVFYLHVAPEVLLSRKPELPFDEIQRQVEMYNSLSQKFKNYVILDGDQAESIVLEEVIKTCLLYMAERKSPSQ